MAKAIQFTKMHGTGNDYIYVNTLSDFQSPVLKRQPSNGVLIIRESGVTDLC